MQAAVAALGERAQHAHHRRDADPAGDEHQPVDPLRRVGGEAAVRAVEPHLLAGTEPGQRAGEVAVGADGELQTVGQLGARGDRERVLLDADDPAVQPEPHELAGGEAQRPATEHRGQRQGGDVRSLVPHAVDHVGPAPGEQRLPHPPAREHREQQQGEGGAHDPHHGVLEEVAEPEDVHPREGERQRRPEDVGPRPPLVARPAPSSPRGGTREQHHPHRGGVAELDAERGGERVEQLRALDDRRDHVPEHQDEGGDPEPPVPTHDPVDPERRGQRAGGGTRRRSPAPSPPRRRSRRGRSRARGARPPRPPAVRGTPPGDRPGRGSRPPTRGPVSRASTRRRR